MNKILATGEILLPSLEFSTRVHRRGYKVVKRETFLTRGGVGGINLGGNSAVHGFVLN